MTTNKTKAAAAPQSTTATSYSAIQLFSYSAIQLKLDEQSH
jgi:hypothetical protein